MGHTRQVRTVPVLRHSVPSFAMRVVLKGCHFPAQIDLGKRSAARRMSYDSVGIEITIKVFLISAAFQQPECDNSDYGDRRNSSYNTSNNRTCVRCRF